MAIGDITLFQQFFEDVGLKVHELNADVVKGGIIDSVVTPTAADATPAWGASSGVDYDGNQVTTGTSYLTGGPDLENSFSQTAGVATLDATDETVAQDGSGFTDGRWMILYNETATNNEAIGFLDFGSATSIQTGDLDITWNANGIARWGVGTIT